MSFDALQWAARQDAGGSAAKLVLLALANYANGKSLAWPSVPELVSFSELDRKTVMVALKRLVRAQLIEDSGERRGPSGQVKAWRLPVDQRALALPKPRVRKGPKIGTPRRGAKGPKIGTPQGDSASPEIGTRPKIGTRPVFPAKGPKNGTRNQLEPVRESSNEDSSAMPKKEKPLEVIFDGWNRMASANGLPVAQALTKDRKGKLKERLAEHDVPSILAAIAKIPSSKFLMGGGPRGWKATFDFLLRPASLNNLIEGSAYFDNPAPAELPANAKSYEFLEHQKQRARSNA